MFISKNKYFLFIDDTNYFDFNLIKIRNKFNIILRDHKSKIKLKNLIKLRKNCMKKGVNFFVANNTKLLTELKADGLYISAFNKELRLNRFKKKGYKIIGSAHNQEEIFLKKKQGCEEIILSRLFETCYKEKKSYLGILKFNNISSKHNINIVPLGGINNKTLHKLNLVRSSSFACLSAIKKKPANIINRLF